MNTKMRNNDKKPYTIQCILICWKYARLKSSVLIHNINGSDLVSVYSAII